MKAGAQPFPSDYQPYQPWPVLVYQCSSFWSLMQWRLLRKNTIFLVHTCCKEAQKIPSSPHLLSPATTHIFSYTWKSYTHYMGSLKWPLISLCWCHTAILLLFLRVFHNSLYICSAQQLLYASATRKRGTRKRFWAPTACFYIYIYIYMY